MLRPFYKMNPAQKYATGKVHRNNTIIVGIPHLKASADRTHFVLLSITAANGVAPGVRNAKCVIKINTINAAEALRPSVAKENA